MSYGRSTFGSQPYGGGNASVSTLADTKHLVGLALRNSMFNSNPLIGLHSTTYNPLPDLWEDLTIYDPRIENYKTYGYPFSEGVYKTNVIDLGKVYYNAKIKVDIDLTPILPEYTTESLQMNKKGKVNLDITGKCEILPPRTWYKDEFSTTNLDKTALLHFVCFWIDNSGKYIYLITTKGTVQKRQFSDLRLIQEHDNLDVEQTIPETQLNTIGIEGITGDSTYIYYTLKDINYVVKRNQSDLGLVKKQKTFTTDLNKPTGIWTDGTLLFICDSGGNRIIKCNALDFGSPSTFTSLANPKRIWGDSTYVYAGSGNANLAIVKITKATFVLDSTSTQLFTTVIGLYGDTLGSLYIMSFKDENILILTKISTSTLSYIMDKFIFTNIPLMPFGIHGVTIYNTIGGYYLNKIWMILSSDKILDALNLSLVLRETKSIGLVSKNNMFNPRDITGDDSYLYVCDYLNDRIIKINKASLLPESIFDKISNKLMKNPYAICTDNTYLYFLAFDELDMKPILVKLKNDLSLISVKNIDDIVGFPDIPATMCYTNGYLYLIGTNTIWELNTNFSVVRSISFSDTFIKEPTACWSNGTYIYITNKGFFDDNYKITVVTISNWTMVTRTIGGNLIQQYGITGEDSHLYVSNFAYGEAFIVKADSSKTSSAVSYNNKFGNYGYNNNNYKEPHGLYLDDKYIYIVDSGNNRIVRREKNKYFRIKLLTDDSMKDGIPTTTPDYYTGYNIIFNNHPEVSQKDSKRRITDYSTTAIASVGENNAWNITKELTNIDYKILYTSKYMVSPTNLYKNPKISIIASSTSSNFDDSQWKTASPATMYDKIRYFRVRVKFSTNDLQTNVEIHNIKCNVDTVYREDSGSDVIINAGGTKILLSKPFNKIDRINLSIGGTSALYGVVTEKTVTDLVNYPPYGGFKVQIFNNSGTDVGGTLNSWTLGGF